MGPVMKSKGYRLSATHLYDNYSLPSLDDIDWLIVMGGPMGVYDEGKYPWLKEEKIFIKEALSSGKIVLGICLGAQLIADALGAKVYRNKHKEIGWFDVKRLPGTDNTILRDVIPERTEAFHWHADTFDIPQRAIAIAKSEACGNQGFIFNDCVLALQFHLEITPESTAALIRNCRSDLDGSKYVQSEEEMLTDRKRFASINNIMHSVLNALESNQKRGQARVEVE